LLKHKQLNGHRKLKRKEARWQLATDEESSSCSLAAYRGIPAIGGFSAAAAGENALDAADGFIQFILILQFSMLHTFSAFGLWVGRRALASRVE
jgi:hypothetical protein